MYKHKHVYILVHAKKNSIMYIILKRKKNQDHKLVRRISINKIFHIHDHKHEYTTLDSKMNTNEHQVKKDSHDSKSKCHSFFFTLFLPSIAFHNGSPQTFSLPPFLCSHLPLQKKTLGTPF